MYNFDSYSPAARIQDLAKRRDLTELVDLLSRDFFKPVCVYRRLLVYIICLVYNPSTRDTVLGFHRNYPEFITERRNTNHTSFALGHYQH